MSGISKGKVKDLKNFWNSPFSVNIIRTLWVAVLALPTSNTKNNGNIVKKVSDKIIYSIYPLRLAIKFHNTAVLYSQNLPSLWKDSPFCDLHCHLELMAFKHPPHYFAHACPNLINMTTMTRHHTWFLPTTSPTKQASRQSSHATRLS